MMPVLGLFFDLPPFLHWIGIVCFNDVMLWKFKVLPLYDGRMVSVVSGIWWFWSGSFMCIMHSAEALAGFCLGNRVTDSLMMHGRNNGKKLMAVRIIKHSFEIIHLLTDQNPIQVLVDAIINR
jgi:hypothetical protein